MSVGGIPHTVAREPGGTPVGEAIRAIVLDKGELEMPPETELFLILAARSAFVREVTVPSLERGEVLLADRFDLSTFAYQGYGRGLELETVRRLNSFATGGLDPDLYLVLDLAVETGMERKRDGGGGDRIEREGRSFLSRVRDGYRTLAETHPRACLVAADGPADLVQETVRRILQERFPETFEAPEV
jgi:dTMP kinase